MSSIPAIQDAASQPNWRQHWRRRLVGFAAWFGVIYCLVLGGFYYAMKQPPETFSRVMIHAGPVPFLLFPFETMWKQARAGTLHVGDAAPDFTLPCWMVPVRSSLRLFAEATRSS